MNFRMNRSGSFNPGRGIRARKIRLAVCGRVVLGCQAYSGLLLLK
jgi:hypothetical protein